MIEVGEEIQEDEDDPLARTKRTKSTNKKPLGKKEEEWSIKNKRKRKSRDEETSPQPKRRREVEQEVPARNTGETGCGTTVPIQVVAK